MQTHIESEQLANWGDGMRFGTKGFRAIYPEWDPEDRFIALEEVRMLLKSRLVNVDCMLEVLFKSNDGCIDFNIGDIAIQFVRGFGVWSERRDVIQMTVEVPKANFGDIMEYEYTLDELGILSAQRLSKACASSFLFRT